MKKLESGSLPFAISVTLYLSILLLIYISIKELYLKQVSNNLKKIETIQEVLSCLDFIKSCNDYFEPDSFNDRRLLQGFWGDSTFFFKRNWGYFSILGVQNKEFDLKKAGLFGFAKGNLPPLYVRDFGGKINVSGACHFDNGCCLPASGIRRNYIGGGRGNLGSSLSRNENGFEKSDSILPKLTDTWQKELINHISGDFQFEFIETPFTDTIENSFFDKPMVIRVPPNQKIENCHYFGNVILFSETSLTIGKSAELKNILIICPEVLIENEFSGEINVIASRKIILEESVAIKFPSSLILLGEGQIRSKLIINENVQVEGAVFHISESGTKTCKNIIEKNCNLKGLFYLAGQTDLKSNFMGNLFVDNFLIFKYGGYYENQIDNLNFYQNRSKIIGGIPVSLKNSSQAQKWLN